MPESYFWVYGTLRQEIRTFQGLFPEWDHYFEYVKDASLPGYVYDTGTFPAFIFSPSSESTVTGEIYRLTSQGLISEVDHYEGATVEDDYLFKKIKVKWKNLPELTVYEFNRNIKGLLLLSDGDYLKYWREQQKKL